MNTIRRSVRVALLCFLVMSSTTLAARDGEATVDTVYVAKYGQDSQACGDSKAPCRTIQAAINRFGEGSAVEIRIAQGTYAETSKCLMADAVVCVLNKQVSLAGGYNDSWTTRDPARHPVVLDGQGRARVIKVHQTAPTSPRAAVSLNGLSVENGYYQGQGSGDDVWTFAFGAGLFAEHASVTVRDVLFRNNRAFGGNTNQEYGGGAGGGAVAVIADAGYDPNTTAILERVLFDGNEARSGSGAERGGYAQGGALFVFGVTARGSQLTFTNNKASAGPGRGDGNSGEKGDRADALGGAVSIQSLSNATFDHVTATGNTARGGDAPNGDAGGAWGGAFYVEGASLRLSDSELRGNSATGGDGVNPSTSASIASGGGLDSIGFTNTNVYLYRVRFIGNSTKSGNGQVNGGASGGGGAALNYSDGQHVVSNCVFAQNSVDIGGGKWIGGGGGGLWLQGVRATVEYVTISGNRLGDAVQKNGAQGLGLLLATAYPGPWPNTEADIRSALVTDHHSITTSHQPRGLAALQAAPNTTANLSGGLWANNTLNDNSVDAAGWRGTINGLGSMRQASSAGFVAPSAPIYNYHLRASAPAKDCTAKVANVVDIDGEPRTFGAQGDAGADEYWPFKLSTTVGPQSLIVDWTPAANTFAGGVARYTVIVQCPTGASAPRQGSCGKPIDVGKASTITLTGVTDGAHYDIGIAAFDASGATVAQSEGFRAVPGGHATYLPSVVK